MSFEKVLISLSLGLGEEFEDKLNCEEGVDDLE